MFDIKSIRRDGDVEMRPGEGDANDVVIVVMGPTGAGKSTFIRNVLSAHTYGGSLPEVSDGYDSCTQNIKHYLLPIQSNHNLPDKRAVIVDTPGFDDTSTSDSEILRRIAVWLASSYDSKMKIGGVIYMYPIYPNRMTRNDQANLKVFRKLCGQNAQERITLTTTKWSLCQNKPEIGIKREEQLRDNFWREMIAGGTHMARLNDEASSASALFSEVLQRHRAILEERAIALEIQRQLVEKGRSIPRTDAGKELKQKLKELLKEHKAASGNPQSRREKLESIARQLDDLKIPLSARIKSFFGLG